tara:strand:+ start:33 stop:542 length:510 start_codon:yes stop_codon:yes gene_type:complete
MKKLIFILITGMFICNISYGATIKELLKGGKSIKLSCTIEEGEMKFEGEAWRDAPDWKGKKVIYEIKGKDFYINDEKFCCDDVKKDVYGMYVLKDSNGNITHYIQELLKITDNRFKLQTSYHVVKTKSENNLSVEINRNTGKYTTFEKTWGIGRSMERGTCEKATGTKF